MKKLFKNKKVLLLVVLVILAILYYQNSKSVQVKTVPVKKVSVEKQIVKKTVAASGEVKSENQADLSFPVSQRIIKIYVAKGDEVKKGQLLGILENQSLTQTAQAYKDARDVLIRERDLFIRNKSTNEESLGGGEQYGIRLRQYNEQVHQAEATYNSQAASLKNNYSYAPFDGTIIDVTKKEGETATASEVVFKIADLNKLQFEIEVDQEDYAKLTKGMSAEVNLDAFTDFSFNGKILDLPLYADGTGNNAFITKIKFDDVTEKSPRLGMTGDAKITVASTQNEVDALYYDNINEDEQSKPYVWVVDNGYISKFPIEAGLEGDIYTEIKTNVTKQIIAPLTSDIVIKDGYKAKIVK